MVMLGYLVIGAHFPPLEEKVEQVSSALESQVADRIQLQIGVGFGLPPSSPIRDEIRRSSMGGYKVYIRIVT